MATLGRERRITPCTPHQQQNSCIKAGIVAVNCSIMLMAEATKTQQTKEPIKTLDAKQKFDEVHNYLLNGQYPAESSKSEKLVV